MSINGVLLLKKPIGLSSNKALQVVRTLFDGAKAGHTGTLDPQAEGLLPVCFGEATKFSQFLINSNKGYSVTMRLGWTSTSGDSEGKLTREYLGVLPKKDDVARATQKFIGEVAQTPPMHSAIKNRGRRLYKLAREGISIPRSVRFIKIHELSMGHLDGEFASFNVVCSKGTYVRTLVEDIGIDLGCGAYVTKLQRTEVGGFHLNDAVSISFLQSLSKIERLSYLGAPDTLLKDFPKVAFGQAASNKIKNGQKTPVEDAFSESTIIRAYGNDGVFLGLGEISREGLFTPKRLMTKA